MKRAALSFAALALLPVFSESAEPVPLDEEFLEYLSEYEGQADNWTWFADDEATKGEENAAAPPEISVKGAGKPAVEQPVEDVKK